jgi:hypothetical protein
MAVGALSCMVARANGLGAAARLGATAARHEPTARRDGAAHRLGARHTPGAHGGAETAALAAIYQGA